MFRLHNNNTNKPRRPPTNLRGIFAGCGTLLNRDDMGRHVLSLTGKSNNPEDVTLVYLGTPSYDIVEKRIAQTSWYVDAGCRVISLDVVLDAPPTSEMATIIDAADVILLRDETMGANRAYEADEGGVLGIEEGGHGGRERRGHLVGICIDHNAAFVIDRSSYRVLRPEDEELPGSVADDGSFSGDRLGRPGVWIKEVLGDGVTMKIWQCPEAGKICDLLKVPEEIVPSVRHMKLAANLNPDDGPLRMSYPGFAAKSFFGGIVAKDYMEALAEGSERSDAAEESDAVDDDDGTPKDTSKKGWIQKEKEKLAAGIQKEKEKVAAGIHKEKEKVASAYERAFHPHAKK
ncbi:hypothetical protein ACHAW5_005890 [Stephanodiscus triporus]|uniref:Uncharacterized protein n=1 Tax=Stephanodiscus triporus TaxID=2934178 RepID=A0ABD3NIA3_9STRA